jgi:hypothetical protein
MSADTQGDRMNLLGHSWTIYVCPECGARSSTCEHVEHGGVEPLAVVVVPEAQLRGAVSRSQANILRDALVEIRDAAEEGTPVQALAKSALLVFDTWGQ